MPLALIIIFHVKKRVHYFIPCLALVSIYNYCTPLPKNYLKMLCFNNKNLHNSPSLILHRIPNGFVPLCHVIVTFFQTVFDPFFISTYNMCYTSMPIVVLGILDQDVPETSASRYGQLYTPGIQNLFFNRIKFASSALQGIWSAFVLVGIVMGEP